MGQPLLRRRWLFGLPLILLGVAPSLPAQMAKTYFPPPGKWEKKTRAEAGMDADKLRQAIGASQNWRWVPYSNSTVEIEGHQVGSVRGGTRWAGGLWIDSEDLARFGLLILNHGRWGNRQLVSEKWLKDAVTPSEHGPDYGYLWGLNTQRQQWRNGPASSFAAIGNGGNTIWIDPDIVFVWHWYRNRMVQRIVASVIED